MQGYREFNKKIKFAYCRNIGKRTLAMPKI
jgi:hypothetical protein